jgi:hypothetical protein
MGSKHNGCYGLNQSGIWGSWFSGNRGLRLMVFPPYSLTRQKDIFLENLDYSNKDLEKGANLPVAKWWIK